MIERAAAEFWDKEVIEHTHVSWMENPAVRAYINRSISGSPHAWPMDWFQSYLGGRRFGRALSIGCGTGPLERDLLHRNLCDSIDAFDGSPQSIELAKEEAARAGISDRVHYHIADFNEPQLPRRTYDAVFFHQSLHHVAKLEKILRAVHRALKADGLVYLDEYIGPSRTDWNNTRIAVHRAFYAMLPASMKTSPELSLPIHPVDPSEAIRSAEIIDQLRIGFDILEYREYGGMLLSVLFPFLRATLESPLPVEELIAAEEALRADGQPSYHAVIVAKPKGGVRAALARANYFTIPKMKRIIREANQLITRHA